MTYTSLEIPIFNDSLGICLVKPYLLFFKVWSTSCVRDKHVESVKQADNVTPM